MVRVRLDLNERHARALLKLVDLLDYEVVRGCASSEQEAYDIVLSLDCLRTALRTKGVAWGK